MEILERATTLTPGYTCTASTMPRTNIRPCTALQGAHLRPSTDTFTVGGHAIPRPDLSPAVKVLSEQNKTSDTISLPMSIEPDLIPRPLRSSARVLCYWEQMISSPVVSDMEWNISLVLLHPTCSMSRPRRRERTSYLSSQLLCAFSLWSVLSHVGGRV